MSPGAAALREAIPRTDSVVAPRVLRGAVIAAISARENETCISHRKRTPLAQRKRGSLGIIAPRGARRYLDGVMPGTVIFGASDVAGAAAGAAEVTGVGVTAGLSLLMSVATSSVMSIAGSK